MEKRRTSMRAVFLSRKRNIVGIMGAAISLPSVWLSRKIYKFVANLHNKLGIERKHG